MAAWVADLSADDPAVRDAAEARLVAAGSRAIPALVAAADDAEPDVAARAWRALRRVRLFAVHGATDDALALANRYLSADTPAVRGVVLAELAELKPVPAVVLVRLLTLEPDAALRARLLAPVGRGYRAGRRRAGRRRRPGGRRRRPGAGRGRRCPTPARPTWRPGSS